MAGGPRWYDRCYSSGIMMPLLSRRFPVALRAVALAWLCSTVATSAAAIPNGSATTDSLLAAARSAVDAGRYAQAQTRYEALLRRDRTNLAAILELSSIYERTGRLEYARGLLIRATRIDPHYPGIEERRRSVDALLVRTLTVEADSLLQSGDYEAAVAKLSLHNTIEPGNADVHYKRALCLFETGQYDAALADIEVAIAAAPQEAYFVLRDRIVGESNRAKVKDLARRAARLASSDNPHNRQQALALLGRILEIDPEHAWARTEYLRLSEPEEDTADHEAAVSEPSGPGTLELALQATAKTAADVGGFLGRHLSALLVLVAVLAVFQSPLTRAMSRRLRRPSLLSGDLSRFPLADVLTTLNAAPHTGVLEVRARRRRGVVYVDRGEPAHCKTRGKEGIDALKVLLACGTGRFAFRHGAIPTERTIDIPLSLILVERPHKKTAPVKTKSKMKELLDSKLGV